MAFSLIRSLVRHALRHIGDKVIGCGVVPVGSIAAGVYDDWCKATDADNAARNDTAVLRAQIERAAQDPKGFVAQAEAEIRAAGNLTEAQRQVVLSYLAQIPGRVRASLRRPDDPSGLTVPAAVPLRKAEDLVSFFPDQLPRFRAGTRPVPGTDLSLVGLLGIGGFGEGGRRFTPVARTPRRWP
jgi:hypothetical protein